MSVWLNKDPCLHILVTSLKVICTSVLIINGLKVQASHEPSPDE